MDRLVSYQYYLLYRTNRDRDSESTGELRRILKSLELTMKEHLFSGDDEKIAFDTNYLIVFLTIIISVYTGIVSTHPSGAILKFKPTRWPLGMGVLVLASRRCPSASPIARRDRNKSNLLLNQYGHVNFITLFTTCSNRWGKSNNNGSLDHMKNTKILINIRLVAQFWKQIQLTTETNLVWRYSPHSCFYHKLI